MEKFNFWPKWLNSDERKNIINHNVMIIAVMVMVIMLAMMLLAVLITAVTKMTMLMTTMITWGEEIAQKWGRAQQGRQRVAKVQLWDNLDIFYQQHRRPSRHRIETHVLGMLSIWQCQILSFGLLCWGDTHYPPHPPFAENKIKVLRRDKFYDKKINPWPRSRQTVLVIAQTCSFKFSGWWKKITCRRAVLQWCCFVCHFDLLRNIVLVLYHLLPVMHWEPDER